MNAPVKSEISEAVRKLAWSITYESCDWPKTPCRAGHGKCGPCMLADKIVRALDDARADGAKAERERCARIVREHSVYSEHRETEYIARAIESPDAD